MPASPQPGRLGERTGRGSLRDHHPCPCQLTSALWSRAATPPLHPTCIPPVYVCFVIFRSEVSCLRGDARRDAWSCSRRGAGRSQPSDDSRLTGWTQTRSQNCSLSQRSVHYVHYTAPKILHITFLSQILNALMLYLLNYNPVLVLGGKHTPHQIFSVPVARPAASSCPARRRPAARTRSFTSLNPQVDKTSYFPPPSFLPSFLLSAAAPRYSQLLGFLPGHHLHPALLPSCASGPRVLRPSRALKASLQGVFRLHLCAVSQPQHLGEPRHTMTKTRPVPCSDSTPHPTTPRPGTVVSHLPRSRLGPLVSSAASNLVWNFWSRVWFLVSSRASGLV